MFTALILDTRPAKQPQRTLTSINCLLYHWPPAPTFTKQLSLEFPTLVPRISPVSISDVSGVPLNKLRCHTPLTAHDSCDRGQPSLTLTDSLPNIYPEKRAPRELCKSYAKVNVRRFAFHTHLSNCLQVPSSQTYLDRQPIQALAQHVARNKVHKYRINIPAGIFTPRRDAMDMR